MILRQILKIERPIIGFIFDLFLWHNDVNLSEFYGKSQIKLI